MSDESFATSRLMGAMIESIKELGDRLVAAIDHRDADLMKLSCEERVELAKKLCEGTSARVEG